MQRNKLIKITFITIIGFVLVLTLGLFLSAYTPFEFEDIFYIDKYLTKKMYKINPGYPKPIKLKDGRILITDVNPVQIFDPVKKKVYDIKNDEHLFGQILLLPDGNLLVVNERIIKINSKNYGVYDVNKESFIDKQLNLPIYLYKSIDGYGYNSSCSNIANLNNNEILFSGCIAKNDKGKLRKHNYIYNYDTNKYRKIADFINPLQAYEEWGTYQAYSVIQFKNNNILIVPDFESTQSIPDSKETPAELYNYKSDKFKTIANLRNDNPILLDNGNIFLAESYMDNLKAILYNIPNNTFKSVATTNNARQNDFEIIKLSNGKILLIGGYISPKVDKLMGYIISNIIYKPSNIVEIFDPTANKFSVGGKLIETRENYVEAIEFGNGSIAVFGVLDTDSEPYEGSYKTTMEVFNVKDLGSK